MYEIMAVTPFINARLILDADQKNAPFEVFVALSDLDNSLVERLGTLILSVETVHHQQVS